MAQTQRSYLCNSFFFPADILVALEMQWENLEMNQIRSTYIFQGAADSLVGHQKRFLLFFRYSLTILSFVINLKNLIFVSSSN